MNQLTIQKITKEAFETQYQLNGQSYALTELGKVMELAKEDTVCMLVEDRLYINPVQLSLKGAITDEEALAKVEALNETFRDAIIHLREFLYSGNRSAEAEQKKREIQGIMNSCISEAKVLLNQCQITDRNKLKKMSKKYFMAEFLNSLFENEVYNGDLKIIPIDSISLERDFCICYHKNKKVTKKLSAFIETCQIYGQELKNGYIQNQDSIPNK